MIDVLAKPRVRGLCVLGVACALWGAGSARAQSEVSLALSAVPVAVVLSAAGGSEGAQALVAAPLLLSGGAVVLTVSAVEASGKGVKYVLTNAADGVSAVVEVSGQVAGAASVGVGTAVQVSATGTGVILSAAGQVLAFIPNEIGKALMHNERL